MAKASAHDFAQIMAELKAGKFSPFYFLQGEESFYIDQISDYIEAHALPEGEKGFNQMVVYGKDTDISGVITHAKRFPMMAQKQVVIVKEAQEMKDLDKEVRTKVQGKEVTFNPLEEYAKKPLDTTLLVICYKYKTLDGRKSLAKTLAAHAVCFESKKIYDNQLPDFVRQQVTAKGFRISEKAEWMMAENIGNNLNRIANEVDKLLVNFKEKTTITEDHVQQFVGISKEYNSFELTDALGSRNVLKANKIVQYFNASPKEHPIQMTLPVILNFYTDLLKIKIKEPKTEQEAGQIIGKHPFIAKNYLRAAQGYGAGKLLNVIGYIRETDARSKGVDNSGTDNGELLKELVFHILH